VSFGVNLTEWREMVAKKAAKKRLKARMKRLVHKLQSRPETFRRDPDIQTELRRVASLCVKLEERLHYRLEAEVFRGVMES
jgi:hypothetical protein